MLILHLSDLHIKDASTWDCVKQDALLQSLNEYNGKVDDCLIVITGDIAYSGKRNQYCQANKICSKILSSVCSRLGINKYLRIVVVPGNHDMDFIKIERDDKYIYDLIESGDNTKIKEQMEKDITALSDFFDFTDKRKCLWKNKLFNKINLSYKDINLSINMVNSAVFSLLSPDKGVHYLPTNYFDEMFLKEDDSNDRHSIVLTVMHHHPEWFHENIKSDFVEKIIESSSILMLGHEHRNSERCITTDTYDSISVIAGGVLSGDNLNRSTYNILIMDTDQMIIDNYCYEWDEHYHLYHKKNIVSSKTELHYKEYNFNRLSISDKYEEYLKYDDKSCLERTTSYFDYFVFPRLVKKGQYNYIEGKEITKWESLKEIIEKDKYISIFGDENSGKTTLAKYIAYNLLKKNTVLYITSEDINGKHIGKTIKNVFEDQYSSESLTFAKFNQIEKKYKVAIVDDIHKIKYSDLTMLVEFLRLFTSLCG